MIYYRIEDLMGIEQIGATIIQTIMDEICYIYPYSPPYEISYIGSPIFLIEHNNLSYIRGFGVDFNKTRVYNGIICHNLEEYITAFLKGGNTTPNEIKLVMEEIYNIPTITKEEYYDLIK